MSTLEPNTLEKLTRQMKPTTPSPVIPHAIGDGHPPSTPAPHAPMNELLHWSLLMLLPLFCFMAVMGNAIIFCTFSSNKLKRFRASLYIRYIAVADVISSALSMGLLWVGITMSEGLDVTHARAQSCKLYTTLRFTFQDMSTWGLLLLLCERFGSLFAPRSTCLTVDLAIGSLFFRFRHVYTVLCLAMLSTIVMMCNMYLVDYAKGGGVEELTDIRDCFNTWKSASDLQFGSMSVIHVLESSALPALFFLLAYVVLRILYNALQHSRSYQNGEIQLSDFCDGDAERSAERSDSTAVLVPPRSPSMDFRPFVPGPELPDMQNASRCRRIWGILRGWFLIIKPQVHVFDEEPNYSAVPPDMDKSLHAMARAHALFFFFVQLPQVLFTLSGCQLLESGGWPLLKNVGLASDLIVNNKATFVLFVYNMSGGRVFQGAVLTILKNLVGNCRHIADPCHTRGSAPDGAAPQGQGQGQIPVQGQVEVQVQRGGDSMYGAHDGPYAQNQGEGREGQGQRSGQEQGQGRPQGQNGGQGRNGSGAGRGRGRRGSRGNNRNNQREFNILPHC